MGYTIGNMRIWEEKDSTSQEVIAWHQHNEWQAQERTIWMDGRPHPPDWAPHTWQGFSTGTWEGDTLVVTTTHLKMAYLERNGVPRSDKATLLEHYIRHGTVLTIVQDVRDPVYTTEPFVPYLGTSRGPRTRSSTHTPAVRRSKLSGQSTKSRISCRGRIPISTRRPSASRCRWWHYRGARKRCTPNSS